MVLRTPITPPFLVFIIWLLNSTISACSPERSQSLFREKVYRNQDVQRAARILKASSHTAFSDSTEFLSKTSSKDTEQSSSDSNEYGDSDTGTTERPNPDVNDGSDKTNAGKKPDKLVPTPQIWKATYQSFNATFPAVPVCQDGLGALVLKDFHLDRTMPFLLGLLQAPDTKKNITNTQRGAQNQTSPRHPNIDGNYLPSHGSNSNSNSSDDDSSDDDNLPPLEKAIKQRVRALRDVLNSVKGTTDDEYRDSLEQQGKESGKNLARFARSDLRVMRNTVGSRGEFFAKLWAAFTGLVRVFFTNPAFVKDIAKAMLGFGAGGTNTSHGTILGDLVHALLPKAQIHALEPLLLEILTPTFGFFFQSLLGESVGSPSAHLFSFATAKGGLRSPHVNLLDAFGKTVEFSVHDDVDSHNRLCVLENLVMGALACQSSEFDPKKDCDYKPEDNMVWMPDICVIHEGHQKKHLHMATYVASLEYEDLRKKSKDGLLPWRIELNEAEGFNNFLLFRSVHVSSSFVDTTYPCGHDVPEEELIPGWPTLHYLTYFQPGARDMAAKLRHDMPLVAVARPRVNNQDIDRCQLLISTRGTTNAFEWAVDVDIPLVPVTSQAGVKAHRGVVHLVNTIYASLTAILIDFMDDPECEDDWRLVITGHSLGGGVTNLLAIRLADDFPSFDITAVSFASPIIFNKAGAEYFRGAVNARTIRFDDDPVPAAPFPADKFPTGFPRCNMVMPLGSKGFLKFHSTPATTELNLLREVGTEDKLNLTSMIGWVGAGTTDLIPTHKSHSSGLLYGGFKLAYDLSVPSPLQMSVAHVCSYACKFSLYCDPNPKTAWMCRQCSGKVHPISSTIKLTPG